MTSLTLHPSALEDRLLGYDMFGFTSLGVRALEQEWAEELLMQGVGAVYATDTGLAVSEDENGAMAWCSEVWVHDFPALTALGPQGMVDGHTLFVPKSELQKRMGDLNEAVKWLQRGARACAQTALDLPQDASEWAQQPRGVVQDVLRQHHKGERLLGFHANAPEQDRWRYTQALTTFASNSALAKDLPQTPVKLNDGWANQHWAPVDWLLQGNGQWQKQKEVKHGLSMLGKWIVPQIQQLDGQSRKVHLFALLLQQVPFLQGIEQKKAFCNGVVQNPKCSELDRHAAIEAMAYLTADRDLSPEGWSIKFSGLRDKRLDKIKAQQWWAQARLENKDELYVPALANLTPWGKPDYKHASVQRWAQSQLIQADLPDEALWDLASWRPDWAMRWLHAHPSKFAVQRQVDDEPCDLFDALLDNLDAWLEAQGVDEVVAQLCQVIEQGGAYVSVQCPELDLPAGWWSVLEATHEYGAFKKVLAAGTEANPALAHALLMHLAQNGDDESAPLVDFIAQRGGNVYEVGRDWGNEEKSIVQAAQSNEDMAIRTAFRRWAKRQEVQVVDVVDFQAARARKALQSGPGR